MKESIKPTFSSLKLRVYEDVYEPAEDSFLLARHSKVLKGRILEIGCGTGIVCLANAKHNPKNEVVACDRSDAALKNAKENAKLNKISNVRLVKNSLFSKIPGKFDFILFNPPYLPTSKEEKIRGKLNYAFDGGKNGREIMDAFLKSFPAHLKKGGAALVVHSSLNGLEKTKAILAKKGFVFKILGEEKFFFEKLQLLKLIRKR